jgi:hypothetical protein
MRHERALEVLVVVLLGAAAIAVSVAVYQRDSHQSAAVWWALATAAFITAVLVPVVWLGVHPFFIWGQSKTAEWRIKSAALAVDQSRRMAALQMESAELSAPVAVAPLTILEASFWGIEGEGGETVAKSADVTDVVRRLLSDDGRELWFQATNEVLGEGAPGWDPAPGINKTLTIRYAWRDQPVQTENFPEGEWVSVGDPLGLFEDSP